MIKKIYTLLIVILVFLLLPPILAPIIHKSDSPRSAIRAELVKRNHPYQSFVAIIKENGHDQQYGKRYDVTWIDFGSHTKMTPTIFYVKKNKKGDYYVVSAGTGP